jgi:hypothetical protein
VRRLALLACVLLASAGVGPVGADDAAGEFRLSRRTNYDSSLSWRLEGSTSTSRFRAGSGTVGDECLINFGWIPAGAYDVLAHYTDLDGAIAGYAWQLSDHQCYDGTFRTDLLIHSEMAADGTQDASWEPNVWTAWDPVDYASFGCIKLSYQDVLALERLYERAQTELRQVRLFVE